MDDIKIIERAKQNLSFIEQLQNQIQLCREALSDNNLPLSPKVTALESLLWAKLRSNFNYKEAMKKLDDCFLNKIKDMKKPDDNLTYKELAIRNFYRRQKAKEQFKAIMVFIDEKGLMPLGEENE